MVVPAPNMLILTATIVIAAVAIWGICARLRRRTD